MITAIHPNELPDLLARVRPDIAMLSLGCFDTLICRETPPVSSSGPDVGGAAHRNRVRPNEAADRPRNTRESVEDSIARIHDAFRSDDGPVESRRDGMAAPADRSRHSACAPAVELMRSARAQGLRIAVVSDTLLSQARLRALIAAAAGHEVVALIDYFFCSSDFGGCTAAGLFDHLLGDTGIAPERILHVGNNEGCEFAAACASGINSVHLTGFDAKAGKQTRLDATLRATRGESSLAGAPAHPVAGRTVTNISEAA